MEKNYIGYLLEALDPEETRAVEAHLAKHPEQQQTLKRLRAALQPLDIAEDDSFPEDLYVRAIARVAEHVVRTEARPASSPDTPVADFIRNYTRLVDSTRDGNPSRPSYLFADGEASGSRFSRRNAFAVIGLSLALLAVVIPAIVTFREHQQVVACQNNLRLFHGSIAGYAETNEGQLPRIDEKEVAGAFATTLSKSGWLSPDARLTCPATGTTCGWTTPTGELVSEVSPGVIEYAYSLGYRDEDNVLNGLRRTDPGTLPILADNPVSLLPRRLDGKAVAANHRRGQNVLFLDGSSRFCTNALVGLDGDNIYCNQEKRVKAGIHQRDSVLGRADEAP